MLSFSQVLWQQGFSELFPLGFWDQQWQLLEITGQRRREKHGDVWGEMQWLDKEFKERLIGPYIDHFCVTQVLKAGSSGLG